MSYSEIINEERRHANAKIESKKCKEKTPGIFRMCRYCKYSSCQCSKY
ncbi:hypothetical protein CLOSBL3_11903 [Clostridiaceae bacterium BL-3]|nr:hypothetical protein CLOSBL3_11903 [Clostridiaceae bacterium BL-3]